MSDNFPSDGPKRDVKSAELNIRLELEHDRFDHIYQRIKVICLKRFHRSQNMSIEHFISLPRRVRAQEAIGEIEKERILLKQKLDIRNSEYEQKAQVSYPKTQIKI